jgi:hypothetical protein
MRNDIIPHGQITETDDEDSIFQGDAFNEDLQMDSGDDWEMISLILAIGESLLHVRYLQRDLTISLGQYNKLDHPFRLSSHSLQDLNWWEKWAHKHNGKPMRSNGEKCIQ